MVLGGPRVQVSWVEETRSVRVSSWAFLDLYCLITGLGLRRVILGKCYTQDMSGRCETGMGRL